MWAGVQDTSRDRVSLTDKGNIPGDRRGQYKVIHLFSDVSDGNARDTQMEEAISF